MSHFVVNLNESEKGSEAPGAAPDGVAAGPPAKNRGCLRIFKIGAAAFGAILLIAAVAGYFYWQSVKRSPEYSLALLVEASRNKDQKLIDELVDTDAAVDGFIPQITDKAIELYGRNLPQAQIARVSQVLAPLLPAIKQRAREEVPRVIDEKTERFASVPYWAIAVGAGRFLDVRTEGETATVVSKIPERQFELSMRRNGERWRVVGIKDEALARRIAQTVGQELIAVSGKEGLRRASEKLGVPELENIRKKVDDIFR